MKIENMKHPSDRMSTFVSQIHAVYKEVGYVCTDSFQTRFRRYFLENINDTLGGLPCELVVSGRRLNFTWIHIFRIRFFAL